MRFEWFRCSLFFVKDARYEGQCDNLVKKLFCALFIDSMTGHTFTSPIGLYRSTLLCLPERVVLAVDEPVSKVGAQMIHIALSQKRCLPRRCCAAPQLLHLVAAGRPRFDGFAVFWLPCVLRAKHQSMQMPLFPKIDNDFTIDWHTEGRHSNWLSHCCQIVFCLPKTSSRMV